LKQLQASKDALCSDSINMYVYVYLIHITASFSLCSDSINMYVYVYLIHITASFSMPTCVKYLQEMD